MTGSQPLKKLHVNMNETLHAPCDSRLPLLCGVFM